MCQRYLFFKAERPSSGLTALNRHLPNMLGTQLAVWAGENMVRIIQAIGNGFLTACFLLLTYGVAGLFGAGLGVAFTGENGAHNLVPALFAMIAFHWWLHKN